MFVDPELDPNDDTNYCPVDEKYLTSEQIDDTTIYDFSDFIAKYGTLPESVVNHPDYSKRKKNNG